MRTRYKKYTDYGLTQDEVRETYDWLNTLAGSDLEIVKDIMVNELPPSIGEYVFMALTQRKGYYKLYHLGLDYCKSDFYGYKRKGLSIANTYMKGAE